MTKDERRAQRKADKALLWASAGEILAAYYVDPDAATWKAVRIAGQKLIALADERAPEA